MEKQNKSKQTKGLNISETKQMKQKLNNEASNKSETKPKQITSS